MYQQEIQNFTQRQYMIRENYEIYSYYDAYPESVALHHHDFYEIYHFIGGSVSYSVEGRHYKLLSGDTLLISPLELHQPVFSEEKAAYERIVLWISKAYLDKLSSDKADLSVCFNPSRENHTNLLRMSPNECEEYQEILNKILQETQSDEFAAERMCHSKIIELLALTNRKMSSNDGRYEVEVKDNGLVEKVVAYINNCYEKEISLDKLAEIFYVSKFYLSHRFKKLVGTSVYRYVMQKRLAVAKSRLINGERPMQVYLKCGFKDYANFYRAFKFEYKTTPDKFMKTQGELTLQDRKI